MKTNKEEMRKFVFKYYKDKGIEPENIQKALNELPELWKAIKASGLLKDPITYEQFVMTAHMAAEHAKIRREMEEFIKRRGF